MEFVDAVPPQSYNELSVSFPGQEKTVKRMTKKGKPTKLIHDTNLNLAQGKGMNRVTMFREFIANFFDQLAKSNALCLGEDDNTMRGVKCTKTLEKGVEKLIYFNKTHLLGVIEHTPKYTGPQRTTTADYTNGKQIELMGMVSYVNYGALLDERDEFLIIGGSEKLGDARTHGENGEGAKRAIAEAIRLGCGVEIHAGVRYPYGNVLEILRFFRNQKTHSKYALLSYKLSALTRAAVPYFMVSVVYPRVSYRDHVTGERYDAMDTVKWMPDDHMITGVGGVVRDSSLTDDDFGTIYNTFRGKVYVHHFFVLSNCNLFWGYDFFCTIGRDRNIIDSQDLENILVDIWETQILIHPDSALTKEFFEAFFVNKTLSPHFLERKAIYRFTHDTRFVLANMYAKRYPEHLVTTHEEEHIAGEWLYGKIIFRVSGVEWYILKAKYSNVLELRNKLREAIISAPPVEVLDEEQQFVYDSLSNVCPVKFVNVSRPNDHVGLKHTYWSEQKGIIINWDFCKWFIQDASLDRLVSYLYFRALGIVGVDGTDYVRRKLKIISPPAPLPRKEEKHSKRPFVEEDEKDDSRGSPPNKRVGVSVPPDDNFEKPVAPLGTKWVLGWCLVKTDDSSSSI